MTLSLRLSRARPGGSRSAPGPRLREALVVNAARIALLAAFLCAWQYLPRVGALQAHIHFLDPFFIGSPTKIADRLWDLLYAGRALVWPYLWQTLKGTFIGVAIGVTFGATLGLLLSGNRVMSRVMSPFITALNATPRIALIPIVVLIAGPTLTASVVTSVLVVFFLAFYNAYAGGTSVADHVLQNARVLGASRLDVMLHVRSRYVMVWTFAALPNAISLGLIAVVTSEILTGALGMGRLLVTYMNALDASALFAVVIVLSTVGVILVGVTELVKRRVLHWWTTGGE